MLAVALAAERFGWDLALRPSSSLRIDWRTSFHPGTMDDLIIAGALFVLMAALLAPVPACELLLLRNRLARRAPREPTGG